MATSKIHGTPTCWQAKLAAGHDLPPAYLNKQLQALVRAGILASTPGVRGCFRPARPPRHITHIGIVAAIEGPEDAFVCTEIRRHAAAGHVAPGRASRSPCPIATAMRTVELAWRQVLAAHNLADTRARVDRVVPDRPGTPEADPSRNVGWLVSR